MTCSTTSAPWSNASTPGSRTNSAPGSCACAAPSRSNAISCSASSPSPSIKYSACPRCKKLRVDQLAAQVSGKSRASQIMQEAREALGSLFRSVGFQAKLLASVSEFLKSGRPEGPSCLVLDVRLPGQSGFDLQRELAAMHIQLPTIFITGHGDIPMSVRAMKGGAIEFLTKPFRDQDLLDAIQLG